MASHSTISNQTDDAEIALDEKDFVEEHGIIGLREHI